MTWKAAPTGECGRQPNGSDAAIQTGLTMMAPFGMALRQTSGFVESLLRLTGLDWAVPDVSTLSRRQTARKAKVPFRGSDGPPHLPADTEPVSATGSREPARGIEVAGEGKWNARTHGGAESRVRRRIRIGIDERSPEVRAAGFTTSDPGDAPMLPEQEAATVTADGALETRISATSSLPAGPRRSSRPARRQALESRHRRGASPLYSDQWRTTP